MMDFTIISFVPRKNHDTRFLTEGVPSTRFSPSRGFSAHPTPRRTRVDHKPRFVRVARRPHEFRCTRARGTLVECFEPRPAGARSIRNVPSRNGDRRFSPNFIPRPLVRRLKAHQTCLRTSFHTERTPAHTSPNNNPPAMTKPIHKRETPRDRGDDSAVSFDLIDSLGGYEDGNLLAQGAEGRVFAVTFLGRPAVCKQRFQKTYRHPTLDTKITRSRLVGEARAIARARKLGVPTPALFYVDETQSALYMERVAGKTLKELIKNGMSERDMTDIGTQVGKHVAVMHDGGLIHGDLTTSNILVVVDEATLEKRVVMIDFGLAHNSIVPEDKGVDLYVLERAINVTHAALKLFEAVMTEYKKASGKWSASFNKFAEVRMRGRKRSMIG